MGVKMKPFGISWFEHEKIEKTDFSLAVLEITMHCSFERG